MEMAHKNSIIILFSLVIQILLFNNVTAQTVSYGTSYIVQSGSKLLIKGSSNINSFVFKTSEVYGLGNLRPNVLVSINSLNGNDYNAAEVCVAIVSQSLDSGNKRMNKDLYKAMNVEDFPFIRYELINDEIVTHPDTIFGWFYVRTKGNLSIAGKTNIIEMKVQIRQLPDGSFNVKGSKSIFMTDYGIKPPTAFFGLIKVKDRLEIHFNIIASAEISESLKNLFLFCKEKNI